MISELLELGWLNAHLHSLTYDEVPHHLFGMLGDHLYGILDRLQQRVVVIVSGDLAHTHTADGPYGYSNASEPFDVVGAWNMSETIGEEPMSCQWSMVLLQ